MDTPEIPRLRVGFHDTPLDVKGQKPLSFQRLASELWTLLDVLQSGIGMHDWIRTSDLFRVKQAL